MNTLLTHEERVAIARLHALLELLPTALDKRLRPAGITGFEYTLLESLAEAEGNFMRMSAVATKTNATLPRISRVVSSLERRDLIERAPCAEDARATNIVLTDLGRSTHAHSRELYAEAVRELVLDGVETLPGNGTSQLASLSYAILSSLDPEGKGGFAHETEAPGDCAADPLITTPAMEDCAADPTQPEETCAADPVDKSCAADPALSAHATR